VMRLEGIEGRVALVTGGARGIGRTIAETLRDLGAHAVAGDLRAPEIEGVHGIELDVTDEASVDAAFAGLDTVDILVCNAGILVRGYLHETSLDDWQRTMDVNVTGAFLCARRAAPAMRERGYGRIVMIGSSAGHNGVGAAPPPLHAYAASKGAIMTLAKSIAMEYAGTGVNVNAVAPTMIRTEMVHVPEEFAAGVIPLGRFGKPQEVADVVAFLCSEHASFMTGEIVDINGGFYV
jgi:3-oxoacyl-[acyl-carrier protein] reductase